MASNMVFLLLSLVFVTMGGEFQRDDLNRGIVLTEILIVLLPAVVFANIYKDSTAKRFLKIRRFKPSTLFKAVGITILTYPIAVFGNVVVITILSMFKQPDIPQVPIASDLSQYILYIAIIGILPGICEEILFRGFFLSMNRELGIRNSILFTGFLFALFHYNIYNFAGPLILGVVFGYVTVITKSIWPAVICHALNNSIASTLGFWALKNAGDSAQNTQEMLDKIPYAYVLLIQVAFLAGIAMICLALLKKLMQSLARDYGMDAIIQSEEKSLVPYGDAMAFMPVIVCIMLYLYITSVII